MKSIKNNYIVLLSLLSILSIMTGCEKEIDVNLNSVDPKIVIEGLVAKDSLAKIKITKTKDFDTDNIFEALKGAIVTISDNKGNSEILQQNAYGFYVSRFLRGKENVTYSLNVEVESQTFTSTSRMPELVMIDSVKMYTVPAFGYDVPMVIFYDPAGIDNYYRNILYVNGIRMDIGNEATDGTERPGVKVERLLPVFDNDREDSRKIISGDTVLVELQSIDRGVFTFFDTLGRMGSSQNNPTSNINGGALGYFSAYSFDRKQIIVE